jgi:hypothetical protein
MKTKHLLTAVALGMALGAQATVLEVDNTESNPGVFTSIQAAHDAAQPNDTIYVHSQTLNGGSMDGAIIRKPLVIIGEGVLPNKASLLPTMVSSFTFSASDDGSTNASGTRVSGLDVAQIIFRSAGGVQLSSLSAVTVSRCRIGRIFIADASSGNVNCQSQFNNQQLNGTLFINNVIDDVCGGTNGSHLVTFRNNIIWSLGVNSGGGVFNFSQNVFLNATQFSVNYGLFENNIFYRWTNSGYSFNNCEIRNNCFYHVQGTVSESDVLVGVNNGSNTGGGNIFNQDPLFVNPDSQQDIRSYSPTQPAPGVATLDYNLQPGSPCIGSALGGGDMGIYGGTTPYVEGSPADGRYRYYPMPRVPLLLQMNIANNVVPAGVPLNVDFIGRKQD